MTMTYTKTERGHRVFTVNGREFRAFWHPAHFWSVSPNTGDGAADFAARQHFPNWEAVQGWAAFMETRRSR